MTKRYSSAQGASVQYYLSFFASWRGQLLICSIVLILGGVYFVLQEPISTYRRRRKEVISRVREEELMSMEKDPVEKELLEEAKEKRGREKKKELKKRKGTLLKVPTVGSGESSATGPSSIESSPAPSKAFLPIPKARSSPSKGLASALPSADDPLPTQLPSPPQVTLSPAASIIDRNETHDANQAQLAAPWEIPLPVSPAAGPSRSSGIVRDSDVESIDGDGDNTSESTQNNNVTAEQSGSDSRATKFSEGFSIIPEEGYLPATISMSKKKKRKGRSAPPPSLPTIDRSQSTSETPQTPGKSGVPPSPIPVTPSSRARKASLTRPVNADLEELLTERERMIETLRAEIGMAKAEEAKAREETSRARATEERLKGDVERVRKMNQRAEHEARKREGELNARLSQLSSLYTAALHRLNTLEMIIRETGENIPPSTPTVPGPGHSPSPIAMHHLQHQQLPSPMPPSSPYGVNLGPSPRQVGPVGFVPYPSPGMYPSPMLHPHFHPGNSHSHSPSPFRRASTGHPEEFGLAGSLTPGQQQSVGSGSYPFDLGIMPLGSPAIPPPTAARQPSPNGQLSAADLRRISIESSVLKKKAQDTQRSGSESGGEGSAQGIEPLPEASEVQGLGVGEVEDLERGYNGTQNGNGHIEDLASGPSSPSPPNRASMLLTPASADLFHRALVVNGSTTPDVYGSTSRNGSDLDLKGIKVIHDSQNGNLYFHDAQSRSKSGSDDRSDNASAYEPGNDDDDGEEDQEEGKIGAAFAPMFASLSHTPQQLAEIQRMREEALKAREKSSDRSRGRGVRALSGPPPISSTE